MWTLRMGAKCKGSCVLCKYSPEDTARTLNNQIKTRWFLLWMSVSLFPKPSGVCSMDPWKKQPWQQECYAWAQHHLLLTKDNGTRATTECPNNNGRSQNNTPSMASFSRGPVSYLVESWLQWNFSHHGGGSDLSSWEFILLQIQICLRNTSAYSIIHSFTKHLIYYHCIPYDTTSDPRTHSTANEIQQREQAQSSHWSYPAP